MIPNLSVLVASCARPTLQRTMNSILPQLTDHDQLLVDVNRDCPWGHAARNRMMAAAAGDCLLFMDDDDAYVPGALDVVRDRFAADPDRLHLFRMRYPSGIELWADQAIREGNVSTQMVAVPNGMAGEWGSRYEGDFDFIQGCCRRLGAPLWHLEVIALVRPEG